MNFLILYSPICSYLILSNQLELLLTLNDNIFSNYISQEIVSGNLTATISHHLPQFLIAPHILSNVPNRETNISECDWSRYSHEGFILDYFL